MAKALIFYNSSLIQSVLSMFVTYYKYEKVLGYAVTTKDTYGVSASNLITYIETTATQDTYTRIGIASLTNATAATGKVHYDAIGSLRQMLVTASKGTTITSGTCASNASATAIVLASTASASNDAYNGKYIETTITATPLIRYGRIITDYDGSSKSCEVAETTPTFSTESTYVVYTTSCIDLVGDASSNQTSSRIAWTTLFPSTKVPKILQLLGGYGSGFSYCHHTTATATSAGATSLTHTGTFDLAEFDGKDFYVFIDTAATEGAGQKRKITSNTANVLTVPAWNITPSGTITYSIWFGSEFPGFDYYLPLAIMTYYYSPTAANLAFFMQLFDRYGDLIANPLAVQTFTDQAALDELGTIGKHIKDADILGVV